MPQQPTPAKPNPYQRWLAYIALGLIGLSAVVILVQLVLPMFGVGRDDLQTGAWPALWFFPIIALPLGAVCIFALLIVSMALRGRANREATK